jgi:hypothetical protein
MSARYWVLASDELMASEPQWPDGLRPIEPATALPPDPGMQWWLFEDDGAPATLDGKRVELTFTRSGDKTMIGGRRPHI